MSLKTESHEGNILDGFHFYFKFFGRNMSTPEYVWQKAQQFKYFREWDYLQERNQI